MTSGMRSNDWVTRTLGYLADWRDEARERYTHINLGTIIVFGNSMESIDGPVSANDRRPDNDNARRFA
jgi:hypothetical protein